MNWLFCVFDSWFSLANTKKIKHKVAQNVFCFANVSITSSFFRLLFSVFYVYTDIVEFVLKKQSIVYNVINVNSDGLNLDSGNTAACFAHNFTDGTNSICTFCQVLCMALSSIHVCSNDEMFARNVWNGVRIVAMPTPLAWSSSSAPVELLYAVAQTVDAVDGVWGNSG